LVRILGIKLNTAQFRAVPSTAVVLSNGSHILEGWHTNPMRHADETRSATTIKITTTQTPPRKH